MARTGAVVVAESRRDGGGRPSAAGWHGPVPQVLRRCHRRAELIERLPCSTPLSILGLGLSPVILKWKWVKSSEDCKNNFAGH